MTSPTIAPIRRLALADLPRCLALGSAPGGPDDDHEWRLLLAAGTGYGIDDPDGGGLIGAYVLARYGTELACVGAVLIARRWEGERLALGRRMLEHALEEADGAAVLTVGASAGHPLYEGLGFTPVSASTTRTGRFVPAAEESGDGRRGRRTARTARAPKRPAARPGTRSATAADLAEIVRLDTEVFGADRTLLIARLPAFSDQLRVAEREGRITGFATAWPNGRHTAIGPVVAEDTATAQSLIADLAAGTDREIRLDTDARHPELESWLDTRGVRAAELNTLLVHGAPDAPGDHRRRFARLAPALG